MPPQPQLTLPTASIPDIDLSQVDNAIVATINPTIVWLVLLLCFLFMIIMSIILRWHWRRYALNTKTEKKMTTLYYLGITISVVSLLIMTILYTVNYQL